jgi:hypothetical protein
MTRYFFDVVNGHGPTRDDHGYELRHPNLVQSEVSRILSEIAREEFGTMEAADVTINVRNEADEVVYTGRLAFTSGWKIHFE